MWEKILISTAISFVVFQVFNYVNLKKQNKILYEINTSILQSALMYFSDADIDEKEMNSFKNFVLSRLSSNKRDLITNFQVEVITDSKLKISYNFRRNETFLQPVSYLIERREEQD